MKNCEMWKEVGNALLNFMVELNGILDTIEWLASIGFSEDDLEEMGFQWK